LRKLSYLQPLAYGVQETKTLKIRENPAEATNFFFETNKQEAKMETPHKTGSETGEVQMSQSWLCQRASSVQCRS
jgi:hypothetical protein